MSSILKIIIYSVGIWIITLALSFVIPIPIISGFAGFLSLLVGFVLFILVLISLVKDKDKISSILAMLLVALTTWLALTRAFDWGAWAHFQLFEGQLPGVLERISSEEGGTQG